LRLASIWLPVPLHLGLDPSHIAVYFLLAIVP